MLEFGGADTILSGVPALPSKISQRFMGEMRQLLTPEHIAIVDDHPTRPFKGLVGFESLKSTFNAHEQLCVEVGNWVMEFSKGLVDGLGKKIETCTNGAQLKSEWRGTDGSAHAHQGRQ